MRCILVRVSVNMLHRTVEGKKKGENAALCGCLIQQGEESFGNGQIDCESDPLRSSTCVGFQFSRRHSRYSDFGQFGKLVSHRSKSSGM